MTTLTVFSYLAPNMAPIYAALGAYVGGMLGLPTSFEQRLLDAMDDLTLASGEFGVAFLCGLPFARREHAVPGRLVPLVAPVMSAPRYADRAVYFSDVLVRAESPAQRFADLSGARLCYNDAGSNSGYNVLRHHLIQHKEQHGLPADAPFFGKVLASGSHQQSIHLILNGEADCAAIDSTVLERQQQLTPAIAPRLRSVTVLGPFPMPPMVMSAALGNEAADLCRDALLNAHTDATLHDLLVEAGIKRFAATSVADYEPLRLMYDTAISTNCAVIV